MGTTYWNLLIPQTLVPADFDANGLLNAPLSDSTVFVPDPKGFKLMKPGLAQPVIARLDEDGRIWTRSYQTTVAITGMFAAPATVPYIVHELGPLVMLDFADTSAGAAAAVGTSAALPVSLRPKAVVGGTLLAVNGGADAIGFFSLANTGVMTLSVTTPGTAFGAGGNNGFHKFRIFYDRRL